MKNNYTIPKEIIWQLIKQDDCVVIFGDTYMIYG
jgi:hypothetical protein